MEASWQPAQLLPESSSPDFIDEVAAMRSAAAALPDDYLVVGWVGLGLGVCCLYAVNRP